MTGISKRRMLIAAATVVLGGALSAAALIGGAAHAQDDASISVTSITLNSSGEFQPSYYPIVTLSITCPVNDLFWNAVTVTQGWTATGSTGYNSVDCTGNPQTVTVSATTLPSGGGNNTGIGAGTALVGASLGFIAHGESQIAGYAGVTTTMTIP